MIIQELTGAWSYYWEGSQTLLPPDRMEGSRKTWDWKTLWDACLEGRLELPAKSFIAGIVLDMGEEAGIAGARVLVDDCPAGTLTGGSELLRGHQFVPVGVYGKSIRLILEAAMAEVSFEEPKVLGGTVTGEPTLWPTPKKATFGKGVLSYAALSRPTGTGEESAFAAEHLWTRLQERGIGKDIGTDQTETGKKPVTFILDNSLKEESYRVRVSREGICLWGADRRALLYAAELLLQLMKPEGICLAEVEDEPFTAMRGFHFGLPPREEIDFTKNLIRTMLLPLRYNQLFVEFAGGMRFDSHPEISEAWVQGNIAGEQGVQPAFPHGSMVAGGRLLEKEEVRDLLDFARNLGFEIIPEIQSWGHTQYMTYAHPEIAEPDKPETEDADTRAADQRTSEFYAHCFCPSNEKSYEILFELAEEIIEVARPQRYVHMGHDEIYSIGNCARCRKKTPAQLYREDVERLYGYLKKKGLGMMIWSDMLQPTERYLTYPAGPDIPKDIVFLDFIWYFHPELDLEENLIPLGHPMVMGNMYSSHYTRYEARIRKPCFRGGQVSTWCRMDEPTLAVYGKLFDLCYSAQMLWSESYRSEQRATYTRVLSQEVLPVFRDELRGRSHAIRGQEEIRRYWPERQGEERQACLPEALRRVCPEAVPADGAEIRIQAKAETLWLRQATLTKRPIDSTLAKGSSHLVGTYTVCYEDGTETEIPVFYGQEVLCLNSRYGEPMPGKYYRHHGYVCSWLTRPALETKDEQGRDMTLLAAEWQNPFPEKTITRILCRENREEGAGWIVAGAESR